MTEHTPHFNLEQCGGDDDDDDGGG